MHKSSKKSSWTEFRTSGKWLLWNKIALKGGKYRRSQIFGRKGNANEKRKKGNLSSEVESVTQR